MPRLITVKEACSRTSLSRTTVWRLTKDGAFPKPIKISSIRRAFVAAEIDGWISDRMGDRVSAARN
ncbi:helix-turn-helix transcriptional regulator [Rhizobium herbae]